MRFEFLPKKIFAILLIHIYFASLAQTTAPNPDLIAVCPMNIIFIMDESGSIAGYGSGTSDVSNQVRSGAAALLHALTGTGSKVAIVEFNTTARRAVIGNTTAYQEVNAATINDFLSYVHDDNTSADNNHYDPEDYLSNPQNTFTNWQDALVLTKSINSTEGAAHLVVFFTDGFPTAYNKSTGGITTGTTSAITATALNNAITAANAVKAQGSHLFVIGFPNPTLPEGNLQAVSGTERYPDMQPDFTKGDYAVSSSQTLQTDIRQIGVVVCHIDMKLSKTVNTLASCPGSNVVFTLTLINEGLMNASAVVVKDYLPGGYTYVGNNGGATFSGGVITWNAGNFSYLQSKSLQITASVNASGNFKNVAEVTAGSPTDGDSSPNNGNPTEDDYAAAEIISLMNCDDGVICTIDECNNGICTHTDNPDCCTVLAHCNDNNACTADNCLNSLCVRYLVNCDDGNICTSDSCDANAGCTYSLKQNCCSTAADCGDNNLCTNDICSNGSCTYPLMNCSDSDPCTLDGCDNGTCTHTTVVCFDNNPCTIDLCAGGGCRFLPITCNDNNACTSDLCSNGICSNTPLDCSDGNACTIDVCAGGKCANTPLNCDDGSPNTIDACAGGECIHTFVSCDNPEPLNILFILDESGSIVGSGQGTAGVVQQVRSGVAEMFSSLSGTNTRVAVIEFSTTARRAVIDGSAAYRQITPATLASYLDYINDNNNTPDNNHYDPEDYVSTQSNTFTNWDAALQLAQSVNSRENLAQLIVFFTDGLPTAYTNPNGTITTGTTTAIQAQALAKAETSANAVKAQGSHIFAVGFPNPSLPQSNLQAISGPVRYPDIEPVFTNADYSVSTSQTLQNDLARIGGLLCRADLSLKNTVSQPVACSGETIIFTLTITNNGLENATGIQVKDYLPTGFTYIGNDADASFAAGILTWNVGSLLNGQSKSLRITTTINASGYYKNAAEITASDMEDSDSQPGNYNELSPLEDDEAVATVVLNCNCYLKITSLTLMFEGFYGEAGELSDGKVIHRDTLCRFNVRANLCQSPAGSVKFLLNGSTFRIENTAPYALNGDQPSAYYTPWIPNPGNYTLTAVAYSGSSASGTAGPPYTVRFTVIAGQSNTACLAPPAIDCTGKVNGTAFKDDCGICSGGTSGHIANSDRDNCGVCFGDNTSCCFNDADCNDNNLCTFDLCFNSACENILNFPDDGNACTRDGCNPLTGEFFNIPAVCNDGNPCTIDGCHEQTGCTHTGTQGCCSADADCNDGNACTADACLNTDCVYTGMVCNDLNPCTADDCIQPAGCTFTRTQGCCLTASDCRDDDPCTADDCIRNACVNIPLASQPSYLKVVNPATSYRKMRLGYSPTGLFSPKYNVIAGGNTHLCITLKNVSGTAQWNKIKVKPQGASSPVVYLGTYLPPSPGSGFFTARIPLSVFSPIDFTQLSYLEMQCSNAAAFEIHIQRIEFTGGASFLWFGNPKTDNYHDGTTGSTGELITTTVAGIPCGASKTAKGEINVEQRSDEIALNAYPNPFRESVTISFMLPKTERARLEIIGVTGRTVAVLHDALAIGGEPVQFDFKPALLSEGMYFYRLTTEEGAILNRKMLMIR